MKGGKDTKTGAASVRAWGPTMAHRFSAAGAENLLPDWRRHPRPLICCITAALRPPQALPTRVSGITGLFPTWKQQPGM